MTEARQDSEPTAGFLRDVELVALVKSGGVINPPPLLEDPYSRESRIQPSSIDLRIGQIFLPGAAPTEPGGEESPITTECILKPGQTAVIETAEEFRLPSNIAGFGFPPGRVSGQGILMTNPGHVDPGYSGPMRFTVINMGRKSYALQHGNDICTVLLFRLSKPPNKDFKDRNPQPPPVNRRELLDRLSADHLDVDERARIIADKAVSDAKITFTSKQIFVPLLVAVVAAFASLGGIVVNSFVLQSQLRSDVDSLESRLDVAGVEQQVEGLQSQFELEKRISDLEDRLQGIEEASEPQQ